MYEAWGNLVTETVLDGLQTMSLPLDTFIKVPAKPRSKAPESLGDKAFRKGKNYKKPYEEITDKVGVRFVVLNTRAVDVVCEAIKEIPNWVVSQDRDFEEERLLRPEVFGYQSSHFIASPAQPLEFNGFQIPMDTNCEIQVRSLTQHAWAETMHDTVYKPKTLEASQDVKRKCAQAVALTESLDQIYCDVEQAMNVASMNLDKQITTLAELYKDTVGQAPLDSTLNTYLLDAYTGISKVDQRAIINSSTSMDTWGRPFGRGPKTMFSTANPPFCIFTIWPP